MVERFFELELFAQIYWGIALIASFIFILVIFSTFLGGDSDALELETDLEIEADTGIGFQFITFKNLVGFFTIFGWSGIACIEGDLSKPFTVIISFVSGLIMMSIMAAMFFYMRKLTSSGTLDFKNAVGGIGEVYLTIGANRSSMGKAHIRIQGALRELEALTDSEIDLKSGTVIKVTEVTDNGILIVETLTK